MLKRVIKLDLLLQAKMGCKESKPTNKQEKTSLGTMDLPPRPPGYKTLFHAMIKIPTAHKYENAKKNTFLAFKLSYGVYIMLINVKMPTIVGILTFMSMINFMFS